MFSGLFLPHVTGVINHQIANSSFPGKLKFVEDLFGHKKDDPFGKENYRSINLLSSSKILQKHFSPNQRLDRTLIPRPSHMSSKKSQYTAVLDKNPRKMKISFTYRISHQWIFYGPVKSIGLLKLFLSITKLDELRNISKLCHFNSSIFLLMTISSSWIYLQYA